MTYADDPDALQLRIDETRARVVEDVAAVSAHVRARADAARERVERVKTKAERLRAWGRQLAHDLNVPARAREALERATPALAASTWATLAAAAAVRDRLVRVPPASGAAAHLTQTAIRARDGFMDLRSFADRSPLGLALAGLAVGMLVGFTLPVTDIERKNVGPIGDEIVDNAKAAASELVERGRSAALEAVTSTLSGSVHGESDESSEASREPEERSAKSQPPAAPVR